VPGNDFERISETALDFIFGGEMFYDATVNASMRLLVSHKNREDGSQWLIR
jgi:hypothetical protein